MARQKPPNSPISRNIGPLAKERNNPHPNYGSEQFQKGPQPFQSKRKWQQQMETQPVAPSFLPQKEHELKNNAQFPAPESLDLSSARTPRDIASSPSSSFQFKETIGIQTSYNTASATGNYKTQTQNRPTVEKPQIPESVLYGELDNSEPLLPNIEEVEHEEQERQKRKIEGSEALKALETEARSQETERIRNRHVDIPDLNLQKQEGNSYLYVSHLHKRYGRKIAVENISISLHQGEVVGLLGPNGAGKTTSFYMIAGFVRPTRGEILLDERNISRWPMFRRARLGISYLPQESSIFRSLTVEQNILAILEYRRSMDRRGRMAMAESLMEHLGVLRLRKQKASTLSGGERRRVEVARALALEPRFLLLDEPFAGIDPIAVSEIKGIIRALAQSNIGILITDHNVRETLDITDRSYIVNLGEILVSGSRAELIASKTARDVYLGADFH